LIGLRVNYSCNDVRANVNAFKCILNESISNVQKCCRARGVGPNSKRVELPVSANGRVIDREVDATIPEVAGVLVVRDEDAFYAKFSGLREVNSIVAAQAANCESRENHAIG